MGRLKQLGKFVLSISSFLRSIEKDKAERDKLTREDFIATVKEDPSSSLAKKFIKQLINALLSEAAGAKFGFTENLYYGLALKEWSLLHDKQAIKGTFGLSSTEMLMIAQGHFEIWVRYGIAAETYHLKRALGLFEEVLINKLDDPYCDAQDKLQYCKALQFSGDISTAATVIQSIIAHHDNDPEMPNYLFYAGAIFKALKQHDKANNYFFEAAQQGPPKFFTKLEMMVIISRTIEEQHDDEDDVEEDAYRMVHAHMVIEGFINEDSEYEDWISDSQTWLNLADKCAMHQMFSLATDFYGLGIMKDPDAFKKPMLWYRFAKSCMRCGRTSDAQLAVKQALTRSPYNGQLLRAQKFWEESTNNFEELIKGEIGGILDTLPPDVNNTQLKFNRAQAIFKGIIERHSWVLGVGSRRDIKVKMKAQLCLTIKVDPLWRLGDGEPLNPQIYPVIIRLRPTWSGSISHLQIYDLRDDTLRKVSLGTNFAPLTESGIPRKLTLSVEVLHDASFGTGCDPLSELFQELRSPRQLQQWKYSSGSTELKLSFVDKDTGEYFYRRIFLFLGKKRRASVSAVSFRPGSRSRHTWTPQELNVMDYLKQKMTLAEDFQSIEDGFESPDSPSKKTGGRVTPMYPPLSTKLSSPLHPFFSEEGEEIFLPMSAPRPQSVDNTLTNLEAEGLTQFPITVTNVETSEVHRGAYTHVMKKHKIQSQSKRGKSFLGFDETVRVFLVRVQNERDITQVSLLHLQTNRIFVFLSVREHLDRGINWQKRWRGLVKMIETSPTLKPLLQVDYNPNDFHQSSEGLEPEHILGKECLIELFPHGQGACLTVIHPEDKPLLGSGFEVWDQTPIPHTPDSVAAANRETSFKRNQKKQLRWQTASFFRSSIATKFLQDRTKEHLACRLYKKYADLAASPTSPLKDQTTSWSLHGDEINNYNQQQQVQDSEVEVASPFDYNLNKNDEKEEVEEPLNNLDEIKQDIENEYDAEDNVSITTSEIPPEEEEEDQQASINIDNQQEISNDSDGEIAAFTLTPFKNNHEDIELTPEEEKEPEQEINLEPDTEEISTSSPFNDLESELTPENEDEGDKQATLAQAEYDVLLEEVGIVLTALVEEAIMIGEERVKIANTLREKQETEDRMIQAEVRGTLTGIIDSTVEKYEYYVITQLKDYESFVSNNVNLLLNEMVEQTTNGLMMEEEDYPVSDPRFSSSDTSMGYSCIKIRSHLATRRHRLLRRNPFLPLLEKPIRRQPNVATSADQSPPPQERVRGRMDTIVGNRNKAKTAILLKKDESLLCSNIKSIDAADDASQLSMTSQPPFAYSSAAELKDSLREVDTDLLPVRILQNPLVSPIKLSQTMKLPNDRKVALPPRAFTSDVASTSSVSLWDDDDESSVMSRFMLSTYDRVNDAASVLTGTSSKGRRGGRKEALPPEAVGEVRKKRYGSSMSKASNNSTLSKLSRSGLAMLHEDQPTNHNKLYHQSLQGYHEVGYINTRPLAHTTHWERRLLDFLDSLESMDSLRKKLSTLNACAPRTLSTEEAICVLAETAGSVGEAVEKLKENEFLCELMLAARSARVEHCVGLYPGGERIFQIPAFGTTLNANTSALLQKSMERRAGTASMVSDLGLSNTASALSKALSNKHVAKNTKFYGNTSPEKLKSKRKISSNSESNDFDEKSNFSSVGGDTQYQSQTFPIGSVDGSMTSAEIRKQMLGQPPYLNTVLSVPRAQVSKDLVKQSPLVLSRASLVAVDADAIVSNKQKVSYGSTTGSRRSFGSSSGDYGPARESSPLVPLYNRNLNGLNNMNDSTGDFTLPQWRRSNSEKALPVSPRETDRNTHSNKPYTAHPGSVTFAETVAVKPSKRLSTSNISVLSALSRSQSGRFEGEDGESSPQKSYRLQQTIDGLAEEQMSTTPLVLLCRRDALKIQQDQTLLKSNLKYITDPIEKKMRRFSIAENDEF